MTDRQRAGTHPPFRLGADWWRRGVVYQVYPRSFADSDGDGVGDLAGLIDHLDHLGPDGLAVDAIWLSPIYPSPGRDVGYDVSDHTAIDPLFGTEADFDRLVAEAHRRGIRVDPGPRPQPHQRRAPVVRRLAPRRGRARTPTGTCGATRPAIDSGGPPAAAEQLGVVVRRPGLDVRAAARPVLLPHVPRRRSRTSNWRQPGRRGGAVRHGPGWLARGVDGFRLDVFNVFLKHPDLPSNPTRRGVHGRGTARSTSTTSTSRTCPSCSARFRAVVDAAPGRMTVGELFVGTTEGAAALTHRSAPRLRLGAPDSALVGDGVRVGDRRRERAFGPERWPTVVLSNHDQPRQASRLAATVAAGDDRSRRDRQGRGRPVLTHARHAVPLLRRGDRAWATSPSRSTEIVDPRGAARQRRLPLVGPSPVAHADAVDGRPGAGFTTGRPWLRLGPDAAIAERRGPGRRPGLGPRVLPPAASRSGAATPSLQDGASRSSGPDARTSSPTVAGGAGRGAAGRRRLRGGGRVTVPPAGTGRALAPGRRHATRDPPRHDAGTVARARARTRRRPRAGAR